MRRCAHLEQGPQRAVQLRVHGDDVLLVGKGLQGYPGPELHSAGNLKDDLDALPLHQGPDGGAHRAATAAQGTGHRAQENKPGNGL